MTHKNLYSVQSTGQKQYCSLSSPSSPSLRQSCSRPCSSMTETNNYIWSYRSETAKGKVGRYITVRFASKVIVVGESGPKAGDRFSHPNWENVYAIASNNARYFKSFSFRHNKQTNIAYMDEHVAAVGFYDYNANADGYKGSRDPKFLFRDNYAQVGQM